MAHKGEKKVDGNARRRFLEQMLLGTLSLNAGIVSGMGLIGKGVETVRISAEETKARSARYSLRTTPELRAYTKNILQTYKSNSIEPEMIEFISERLSGYVSHWLEITGMNIENKENLIRLILTIMEKESSVSLKPTTFIGSSVGPAQITEQTYSKALDYFIESLTSEVDSGEAGTKRVAGQLIQGYKTKFGDTREPNLAQIKENEIVSYLLREIAPKPKDRLAYTDKDYAFEIAVITALHHIDFIMKNYNVSADSKELRSLLFASWNAGLEKPRETYLQYMLYLYAEKKNPQMVKDAFLNNPDILEDSGLSISQISSETSFTDEDGYIKYIDGSISKVELELLARIIQENQDLALIHLPVGETLQETKDFLKLLEFRSLDGEYPTDEDKYFKVRYMNSRIFSFLREITQNLEIPRSNLVAHGRIMAAMPAARQAGTLIGPIKDPRFDESSTTLGYIKASEQIFQSLG